MEWRRMTIAAAEELYDLRAPDATSDVLYVASADGWTLWTYKVSNRALLAQGNSWQYWVRRDSDHMEWHGGGSPLSDAKASAEAKLAKVRVTGRS